MSNTSEASNQLSPLQRAVFALKEMRSQLDALEQTRTEPIAIIGIGCRFPGGANDPESFWQLCKDGVDATREIPSERWDIDTYYDPSAKTPGKMYTRRGGFLDRVDEFDAEFFSLAPREAASMDPQQRLLLEVSYSALENAGTAPDKLTGSQSGVFIGISAHDYEQLGGFTNIDVYTATGNALSIAAGRLSYFLGLSGPSLAVDTACSSSLVAVHLACQSLRAGECRLALAGGVQLILSPQTTISMSKMQALSPDGRCKTFDAAADGYGRGEGCGIVVLKRLCDAVADGDNILALIRGSAVNQDGKSSGLTVPNGLAQRSLIRTALANAKVEPNQVNYVEAHGTGTTLGDPIEVKALEAVLGKRQPGEQPLMIGSVKTNIGHLEAAAGVASLIKVVLAMQHEEIPPHLHLSKLNPHISLEDTSIIIPTEKISWPSGEGRRRIAGVSSFGFSGTNAHAVLEEAPISKLKSSGIERPFHLLTLSAKSEAALKELAGRFECHIAAHSSESLEDIFFTANTGRSHFTYRLAVVADSPTQVQRQLAAFASGKQQDGLLSSLVPSTHRPKVAFLFAGQGSQYIDMGRQLYDNQPTFRKAIERCDELLRSYLNQPLLSVLYPEPGSTSSLHETAYTQPALFALEYALAQLWRSWGIEPAVVMGNDVGEYVAACIAGVFSLEDGLKLIVERGKMAAAVKYSSPNIRLISTVTGQLLEGEVVAQAEYWCHDIREPVRFAESMQTLYEQGYEIFLEIGPHPTLIDMGSSCLPKNIGTWLPSLHKKQEDWQVILSSLGTLYVRGLDINWAGFDRDYQRHRLSLPTYPFERQRYWLRGSGEDKSFPLLCAPSALLPGAKRLHPLLDKRLRSPLQQIQFESQFKLDSLPLVKDHWLAGLPVMNLVIYLEMALAGAAEAFGTRVQVLEDVFILQALTFPEKDIRTIQLIINPEESGKASFQIFSLMPSEADEQISWTMHATGKLCLSNQDIATSTKKQVSLKEIQAQYHKEISSSEFYQMMAERGVQLGSSCQLLEQIWWQERKVLGKIAPSATDEIDSSYQLPLGIFDACFQLLSASFSATPHAYAIAGFKSFRFYGHFGKRALWSQACLRPSNNERDDREAIVGDVCLFDEAGQLVAEVVNVQLKRLNPKALQRNTQLGNRACIQPTAGSHRDRGSFTREKLLAAEPGERQRMLETYLMKELASSLQLPLAKLYPQQYLASLLDSLMAFELRSRIETDLRVRVSIDKFFGENSIAQLAGLLLEQIVWANLILLEPSSTELGENMEEISL